MSDHKHQHDKNHSSRRGKSSSTANKYEDYDDKYAKQVCNHPYSEAYYNASTKQETGKTSRKRAHSPKSSEFYKESYKDAGKVKHKEKDCVSSKSFYKNKESVSPYHKKFHASYSVTPPPFQPHKAPAYNDYTSSGGNKTTSGSKFGSTSKYSDHPSNFFMPNIGGSGQEQYSEDFYSDADHHFEYTGDGYGQGSQYYEYSRGRANYGGNASFREGRGRGVNRGYHDNYASSGYADSYAAEYEPQLQYHEPKNYNRYNEFSEDNTKRGGQAGQGSSSKQLSRYVIGDSVVYGSPGHYPQGLLSRTPSPPPRNRYSDGRSYSPDPRKVASNAYQQLQQRPLSPLPHASSVNRSHGYGSCQPSSLDLSYAKAHFGMHRKSHSPPLQAPKRQIFSNKSCNKYSDRDPQMREKYSSPTPTTSQTKVTRDTNRSEALLKSSQYDCERTKPSSYSVTVRRSHDNERNKATNDARYDGKRFRDRDRVHDNEEAPLPANKQSSASTHATDRQVERARKETDSKSNARHSKSGSRSRQSQTQDSRQPRQSEKTTESHTSHDQLSPSNTSTSTSALKKKPLLSTPPRTTLMSTKSPLLSTPPVLPLPSVLPPPLMGVGPPNLSGFPPLLPHPSTALFSNSGGDFIQRAAFDGALGGGRGARRGREELRGLVRRPGDLRGLIESRKERLQRSDHFPLHTPTLDSRSSDNFVSRQEDRYSRPFRRILGNKRMQDSTPSDRGRSLNTGSRVMRGSASHTGNERGLHTSSRASQSIRNRAVPSAGHTRGAADNRTQSGSGRQLGRGRTQNSNCGRLPNSSGRLQSVNSGRLQNSCGRLQSTTSGRLQNSSGRLQSTTSGRLQNSTGRLQSNKSGRLQASKSERLQSNHSNRLESNVGGLQSSNRLPNSSRQQSWNSNRQQQRSRVQRSPVRTSRPIARTAIKERPARPTTRIAHSTVTHRNTILRKYQRLTGRRQVLSSAGDRDAKSRPAPALGRIASFSSGKDRQRSEETRRAGSSKKQQQQGTSKVKSTRLESPSKPLKSRKMSPERSRYNRSPPVSSKASSAKKRLITPLSRSPTTSRSSSSSSSSYSRSKRNKSVSHSPRYSKSPRHNKFSRSSPGYAPKPSRSKLSSATSEKNVHSYSGKSCGKRRARRSLSRSPTTSRSVSRSHSRKSMSPSLSP